MGKRGSLYIIPNEDDISEEEFYREVVKDHLEALNEFSEKYNLNYNFTEADTQIAPCVVASDGHLVIKIEEESGLVVCYIPKIVTDRQNNWIHANANKIEKYKFVGGFGIKDETDYNDALRIKDLNTIIKVCDKRNLFYEKKEVDRYVRKEI